MMSKSLDSNVASAAGQPDRLRVGALKPVGKPSGWGNGSRGRFRSRLEKKMKRGSTIKREQCDGPMLINRQSRKLISLARES